MIGFVLLCKSRRSSQLQGIPLTVGEAEIRLYYMADVKHVDLVDGFKED